MTDDPGSVDIIVHGPTCIHWVEPTKTSDYVVLALKEVSTDQGYTAWVCPTCEKVVLELWDYGTIDFGTMDLEPQLGDMEIEVFENVMQMGVCPTCGGQGGFGEKCGRDGDRFAYDD